MLWEVKLENNPAKTTIQTVRRFSLAVLPAINDFAVTLPLPYASSPLTTSLLVLLTPCVQQLRGIAKLLCKTFESPLTQIRSPISVGKDSNSFRTEVDFVSSFGRPTQYAMLQNRLTFPLHFGSFATLGRPFLRNRI